jgi:hypothetical protein
MTLRQRFLELQAALNAHQALWRPSPFYIRRPDWFGHWPELADAALRLDEDTLTRLRRPGGIAGLARSTATRRRTSGRPV